jgi:hypothetical protein
VESSCKYGKNATALFCAHRPARNLTKHVRVVPPQLAPKNERTQLAEGYCQQGADVVY